MRINRVKQALKEGKVQLGCSFSQLRLPEVPRILAAAGLDWTFIDAEHGGFDQESLQDLSKACVLAGICPIVRVADLQYPLVARALDCGAQGILLPRVESPELLAKAVSWTRFPPQGVRGFGLTGPHLEYENVTMAQVIEHMNQNILVVFQIETQTALDRLEELLSVPNIDAVMIGPADLSISLGVPGQFEHPKLIEAMERVRESCDRHGVAPGLHLRSIPMIKSWRDRGMRFLSCNSETGFLLEKAAETVTALRP